MTSYLRCFITSFWAVLLVVASHAAQAQVYLNLGLEPRPNHGQPLALWSKTVPPGGRLAFDSLVFREGRSSLRLELPASADGPRATYLYTDLLPLDSVRGKLVTVSAWVRTQNWQGRAGLSATSTTSTVGGLSTDRAAVFDTLPATTEWRRIELRLPVKATAFALALTLRAQGSGRIWFDDMQLQVEGRALPEVPVPATETLLLPSAEALVANWDFERRLPPLTRPNPAAATVALDSASPQHGRRYLRVVRTSAASQPAPAAYLGTLALARREGGKTLRVMGYWRQSSSAASNAINQGITPTFAIRLLTAQHYGDAWRADTLGSGRARPAPGPQWTSFAFEVPVQLRFTGDEAAALGALTLSLVLPSTGVVELDNLSFALDGKPYVPTGPPAPPAPTPAEQAWLRTALRPLRLAAPATAGPDLAALASWLGAARVVGLGEVTHGSHEVFSLNQRLARYLIEEKGFTGLLLEASPAGCAALHDYLRTGQGDPARLLAAVEGWNTPEMLDLLRALRSYHQAHPTAPLLLAGLDVRQPEQALAYLGQLVAADDAFAQPRLRQLAQLLATYPHPSDEDPNLPQHPDQPRDSLLVPLRRLLAELSAGLDTRAKLGRPTSPAQLARQHYYLRLVGQGATWRRLSGDNAFNYRQACLAENVQYLSQSDAAASRLLVWASNGSVAHVLSPEERPMGEWLRATFGSGYVALGVVLGQGSFAARAPSGQWAPAHLAAAQPGSYEAWLRTGPGAFWLPLKKLTLTETNAWLFQNQLLREIGYGAVRNQFMVHSLRSEFDAVLFLPGSTPVRLLP
ncbi:MAG: erythromycin esterase family protein [Janthinobacterium lividum]